jgi:RNA-directed DNA polymerase|tara:strand:- start:489 stop:1877 length:1389 start_codon:yes stop_codon:yes gene_type:complete
MLINDAQAQKAAASEYEDGRNLSGYATGAEIDTAVSGRTKAEPSVTMEAVTDRANMMLAYQRVVENKGAAGVDNLSTLDLKPWLKQHWQGMKVSLAAGSYLPRAIRKVDIPKPNGDTRTLGVPTVVDRLIQQAIAQRLSPLVEPHFSHSSYGFRPNRNAWQAVQQAQQYIRSGKRWVVDMDLEKFFDRVDHDILMSKLANLIEDKRPLKLIRRFLEADMMDNGQRVTRDRGMPQGGPLSPLLSNILLDSLDKELERRGHSFCRYADDCNIYVSSQKAGESLLTDITEFLSKELKLQVNADKSAVAKPWERKFLGYSFTRHKESRVKIAAQSVSRFKDKIREMTTRHCSRSINETIHVMTPVLRGWISYFRLTKVKGVLEELDGWIRRKLRCLLWRQWKRVYTRARNLMKAGLTEERAWWSATNQRGAWWNAGASHMNQAFRKGWFDKMGLVSLLECHRQFQC